MIRGTILKLEALPGWSTLSAMEKVVLVAKTTSLRARVCPPKGTHWRRVFDEVPPEVGDFLATPDKWLSEARNLSTREILEAFSKSL